MRSWRLSGARLLSDVLRYNSPLKVLRYGSHGFTCKLLHICPSFVSVHYTEPPMTEAAYIHSSLLLIYRPRRDERLSWPGWLTCSERFTYISGHPSATARTQNRESSPAKDRRSTTVSRHQPCNAERQSCEELTVLTDGTVLCTAVAVVIQRVGLNYVTLAVDGSLYRFHPHFKQLMSDKITQLLPSHLQVHTCVRRSSLL